MKEIKAYHCDFCKKYSISKGVITKHEKKCFHNPVTKACATCEYFNQEEYTRPYSTPDGMKTEITASRPICKKGIEISWFTNIVPFPLSDDTGKTHEINLRSNCSEWKQKTTDHENDEEY